MDKNKAFIIMAMAFGAVVFSYVAGDIFIDRVADRVIEKLSKEYSPSPYGPGLDPDKLNVDVFNRSKPEQPQRASYPWE